MRKLLILLCFLPFALKAETYYVATTGSDSYDGLAAAYVSGTNGPWATWQKSINTAVAGDTVYYRGGVYMPSSKTLGYAIINYNPGAGYGHNGTYGNEIVHINYPGEIPILDGSVASTTSPAGNYGIAMTEVSHVKFIGLTIRNVRQLALGGTIAGIYGSDCGNMWFERMNIHNIGGEGFWMRGYDTLYLTNCDSHHNCDTLGDEVHTAGGMGDGFLLSSRATSAADSVKTLYMYGCRAWECTDDGFDMNVQETYVEKCWSWNNGAVIGGPGGVGFKTNTGLVRIPTKKIFKNCITAYNQYASGGGIYFTNFEEGLGTIYAYYNNFSYYDSRLTASFTPGDFDIDNFNAQHANNIAYHAQASYIASFDAAGANYQTYPYAHLYTNTYRIQSGTITGRCETNPAFSLSDADFVSLDTSELATARNADGSLPSIDFGTLVAGSDLIDAGTYVGIDTIGSGADLGWKEYGIASADSALKYILSFSLAEQTGVAVIDSAAKTVDIKVEAGTNVTALIATFTLSEGATAAVGATPQVSGTTANNFTSPVTYVVTALDGSTQNWTITVTVEDNPIATVTTTSATYTAITASVTGRINSANGGTLTARGVCWSTSNTSPTVSDKHTTFTPYVGTFTDVIRGLKGNTTYYVRAYATTSEGGTSYGDAISFTTDTHNVSTQGGKPVVHNGQIVVIK